MNDEPPRLPRRQPYNPHFQSLTPRQDHAGRSEHAAANERPDDPHFSIRVALKVDSAVRCHTAPALR